MFRKRLAGVGVLLPPSSPDGRFLIGVNETLNWTTAATLAEPLGMDRCLNRSTSSYRASGYQLPATSACYLCSLITSSKAFAITW